MSQPTANQETFASGRYSKRKRTQIVYCLEELDVEDSESDYESRQSKKPKATRTSRPLSRRNIFPFLELPAEIRNTIYEYALTDPSGIFLVSAIKHRRRTVARVSARTMHSIREQVRSRRIIKELDYSGQEPTVLVPSLLAVSKQIYHEGRDILSSNEFVFADTSTLYNLLINLGPTGAPLLKKITLLEWQHGQITQSYNHACFAVLAMATNLSKVSIHDDDWYRFRKMRHTTKGFAEQIYRDAFPWLEAVGIARCKGDAAVDILQFNKGVDSGIFWDEESAENTELRDHLRELLGAQTKRVMARPVKKKDKKSVATEEV